jgi:hypothetical protein
LANAGLPVGFGLLRSRLGRRDVKPQRQMAQRDSRFSDLERNVRRASLLRCA